MKKKIISQKKENRAKSAKHFENNYKYNNSKKSPKNNLKNFSKNN